MKWSFEFDHPDWWSKIEKRHNAILYENQNTGDRFLLLRVRGPGKGADQHSEQFVIRYFPKGQSDNWVDLATVSDEPTAKKILRENMVSVEVIRESKPTDARSWYSDI